MPRRLLGRQSLASEMAVTVDDLPWVKGTRSGETTAEGTHRLLAHLAKRHVTAVGFVNCARTAGHPGVLDAWRAADAALVERYGR
ncbi:MAG: hypothetical protein JXB39_11880 [Deltaproteobacteria bacterium]|nr:hypothetical protein [Deltaproteobacteria bacterium]